NAVGYIPTNHRFLKRRIMEIIAHDYIIGLCIGAIRLHYSPRAHTKRKPHPRWVSFGQVRQACI
ncbi:MAG: hypothetical protein KDJ70_07480, partial [Candidatus Competibacteraceae bacterium]|nr:hypothetical protein [Candidatus Competibacteraceae bacterium]